MKVYIIFPAKVGYDIYTKDGEAKVIHQAKDEAMAAEIIKNLQSLGYVYAIFDTSDFPPLPPSP